MPWKVDHTIVEQLVRRTRCFYGFNPWLSEGELVFLMRDRKQFEMEYLKRHVQEIVACVASLPPKNVFVV